MQKNRRLLYWLILVTAAVLYTGMALPDRIWADEAYTFAMLRHSFSEIWVITAADVHPPLYYFLVKLLTAAFGYSQFSVRLFSGVCYFLILAIGGWQIGKFRGEKTGLLFMVLFLLYPFSLDYAVEARMYALAALAVFLNALFAYRVWEGNRLWDWFGFTLSGLCGAYTHYFALVSVGVIYGLLFLCCLVRRRTLLKPWLAASLVTIVLYLPWLSAFLGQLSDKIHNEYWIKPISISTIFDYAVSLLHANGHSVFPLFFGLLLIGVLIMAVVRRQGAPLLALSVPVLTMVLGLGASFLIRPVFVIRYLIPCGPLLIFFLACGIAEFRKEALVSGAVAVLLVSFSGNLVFELYDLLPCTDRLSTDLAREKAQACVVLSENDLHVSQVLAYYLPDTPIYADDLLGDADPYGNIFAIADFSPEGTDRFLLFTDQGVQPSGDYAEEYSAVFLGTFRDISQDTDAWLLARVETEDP